MNESYEVVKERNDKNKAFHKRLKTYYIGLWVLVGVMCFGAFTLYTLTYSKIAVKIGVGVLIVIIVVFFVWCIVGANKIRCPHCNKFIGRSDPWNIPQCPYCGTSLKIQEFYGHEKL